MIDIQFFHIELVRDIEYIELKYYFSINRIIISRSKVMKFPTLPYLL